MHRVYLALAHLCACTIIAAAPSKISVVQRYFDYWNVRDMTAAANCFSEDCMYEDTLYPGVFQGKAELKTHLLRVAAALPRSFQFRVQSLSTDPTSGLVGVQWRVEAEGKPLPFARGCSMYTVNKQGLICAGFDVPEPALKVGSFSLGILRLASSLIADPLRLLPLIAWVLYCYGLFISDATPGVNALALDPATWQLVKDLSTNFALVLPVLSPDSAPVLHPVLEGLFNLVLAWAGLLGCFVIDGRKSFGVGNAMSVPIAGMQLLTNAIYLPYLATRENEAEKTTETVYTPPLTLPEKIGESKLTCSIFGAIGVFAFVWAIAGRAEFGDLEHRLSSFTALAKSDRLTFAFVVDAAYFALFQGWLVDDDSKRRAFNDGVAISAAKYVPFLGLVYYLLKRPALDIADE